MRRIAWVLAAWIALVACSGGAAVSAQGAARCANCGMRVDSSSAWRAGATAADGSAASFDSPKCLLRWLHGERGRGAREPWVIEYYSSERRPAEGLFYVLGADVRGPMGRDLVPVGTREQAERFRVDHQGQRVLAWSEIDAAVIDGLFRP